ncbi:hypothetical protein ScPMuIL_002638 [Solemya velum]
MNRTNHLTKGDVAEDFWQVEIRDCVQCTEPGDCVQCTGPGDCVQCTGPGDCVQCTGPGDCVQCTEPGDCGEDTEPRDCGEHTGPRDCVKRTKLGSTLEVHAGENEPDETWTDCTRDEDQCLDPNENKMVNMNPTNQSAKSEGGEEPWEIIDEVLDESDTYLEDEAVDSGDGCDFCCEKEQVRRRGQIRVGDQIEIPTVQLLAKLTGIWPSSRFATITKIDDNPKFPKYKARIRLTLVEFSPSKPHIQENVRDFDLKNDYFLVLRPKHVRCSPNEYVQEAYRKLEEYRLQKGDEDTITKMKAKDRLEHLDELFSQGCTNLKKVAKKGESIKSQLKEVGDSGVPFVNTCLSRITAFAKKLSEKVKSIVAELARTGAIVGGGMSIGSLVIALFITVSAIAAIRKLYRYFTLFKDDRLCAGCLHRKIAKVLTLLVTAMVFICCANLVSQFGLLMIATGTFFAGLSIMLTKAIDSMNKYILSWFPSGDIPKKMTFDWSDIKAGDAITFTYCNLPHEGIVTSITPGDIFVTHYGWIRWFGKRQIIEERIPFNRITNVHDYAGVRTYTPAEVIRRANMRLGEKRFNAFTNRSSHFVAWCKVGSGRSDWQEVFSLDHVTNGDLVRCWMYGRKHCAVLVHVDEEKRRVNVIHYGHESSALTRRLVRSDWIPMDLKINSLWIRKGKLVSSPTWHKIEVEEHPTSQDTTNQDTTSQDTTNQDTTNQDTTSQDTTSQDTTSQDTTSQDTTSQDTTSQDTTSQDTASQDTTSQDTTSQDTTNQDTTSQDTTSQDTTNQDTTSQDTASQDTTNQDTTSQDTTSQDTTSQDTASQGTITTGYNKPGYNKPGYNKPGYNKPGYSKPGYNKTGYNKPGYNKTGYNKPGYNKPGYNKPGYNKPGYNKPGYSKPGYNKTGYNKTGYNKPGYNKPGYNKPRYNKPGYNKPGYNNDRIQQTRIQQARIQQTRIQQTRIQQTRIKQARVQQRQDTTNQDTTSQDTTNQDTTSQDTTSQGTTSQDTTS